MIKKTDLIRFDMADGLKTKEDIKTYLNLVIADGDASELARALEVVARSEGMTKIAKETNMNPELLNKALREGESL